MKINRKNKFKYILNSFFVFILLFTTFSLVSAQTASTTNVGNLGDTASTSDYVSPYTVLPNPYANLSPEEQAKLPISAQVPAIIEQVSVDIVPEVPRPGDTVTLSVSTFGGIDINSAMINWVMNGKSSLKGRGEKRFSFQAGTDGNLSTIELHIQPQYGAEVVKTFKFNPAEVDVLWQANTYTPPFYKGKALYTPEADLQFVAMPNIIDSAGQKIQPSKAVYDWEIGFNHIADKSGYGVNYFNYTGSIISKPTKIRVTAYDPLNKESAGTGNLVVEPIQPTLLMYEVHPTYGTMFNNAANGTYNFGAQDIQLGVYPYFYSSNSRKGVNYQWSINDNPLDTLPKNQDFLVLQKIKQDQGKSSITVSATMDDKALQLSNTSLDLLY